MKYYECSAKADIGLADCFEDIFETSYINKYIEANKPKKANSVNLDPKKH